MSSFWPSPYGSAYGRQPPGIPTHNHTPAGILYRLTVDSLNSAMQTVMNRDDIIRRETWIRNGWNLRDDDTPSPPELDPLASAQARRAARQQDQQLPVIAAL